MEEKLKVIANLLVMLDLGDEIVAEATPLYDEDANEIYTIVDWNINAQKLRNVYKAEIEALTGAKTIVEAIKRMRKGTKGYHDVEEFYRDDAE